MISWPIECGRNDVMGLLRLDSRKACNLPEGLLECWLVGWSLWELSLRVVRMPSHRSLCVGTLVASPAEHSAESQHQLPARWVSLFGCPAQSSLQMTIVAAITCSHIREPPSWASRTMSKIINYSPKSLSFRVICYAAIVTRTPFFLVLLLGLLIINALLWVMTRESSLKTLKFVYYFIDRGSEALRS